MVTLHRAVSIVGLILSMGGTEWHPVHAARVELDARGAAVTAVVRVYRDDFPPGTDRAAVTQYLARTLRVTDGTGAQVALRLASLETEGDRLRITVTGNAAAALLRGTIAITLLQERFIDQVNVASIRVDGRRAQLVFLRGDASQALP